jgi:[ribosomal protein S5]-alanine N-acetyltransferase
MSIDNVFQNFPQLETERLILRRMQTSDAEALFRILSDEEVTRHYDDAAFTQLSQASEQIEAWESGYAHRRCIRWGITLKEEYVVIGSCGFYGIHPWHLRGSIGYELARPFWRKGIMAEAITALLNLGFGELGLNRIDAVVIPENVASIRLLEKLGFCNEGLLHGYENWDSKGFVDLYMLAISRKAWKESSG